MAIKSAVPSNTGTASTVLNPAKIVVGERANLIDALLSGKIVIERLSDDRVVLVDVDGSRRELTPQETAELSASLLNAASTNRNDHEALIRLYTVTAGQNLQFDDVDALATTGTTQKAQAAELEEKPVEVPENTTPHSSGESLRTDTTSSYDLSPAPFGGVFNADHAQFGGGYKPGFIGPARGHLDGLPDEDLTFRDSFRRGLTIIDIGDQGTPLATDIGDRQTKSGADQGSFANTETRSNFESGFVGPAISHLAPLLNEEYRFQEIAPQELGEGRNTLESMPPVLIPVPIQPFDLTVIEDEPIAGTIFPNGIPGGGSVNTVEITQQPGIGLVTIDARGEFSIVVPEHFSGTITFDYSYRDSTGTIRTDTATVLVQPIADAPFVSVGVANFVTNEDTGVALTGLAASLVDSDGSETLTSISIEGVPIGFTFTDTAGNPLGTDNGNGIWSFAPGEVERAILNPHTHTAGTFNLVLSATTTEGLTGLSATTSVPFSVVINPVADAPAVSVGAGLFTAPEDTTVSLSGFGASLVDQDGSETLSNVIIQSVPPGGLFVDSLGNPLGSNDGLGTWTFTAAELANLNFIAPEHVAGVFDMQVVVTATENATGQTATTTLPFRVVTTPVTDAPATSVGAGTFTGDEDTRIALPGLSAALVDTDGSETIASVRILDVPAGSSFTDGSGNPIGTNNGDGTWNFTPTQLIGLQFDPSQHVNGSYALTLEATTRETATGLINITTLPFSITVTAVADQPVVPATSSSINEDTTAVIGTAITYGLVDQDGSERISDVTITGFPVGATVTLNPVGGANVVAVPGGYIITGSEADIRATLDGLALQPPVNSDADIALSVTVTTTDANGSMAIATGQHTIAVAAIADTPVVSGGATGNEDSVIAIPVTVALTDTDGSESISSVIVSQVPVGAVIGWNASLPGTVVANTDGTFTFSGSTANIQALLATLTVQPPLHSGADFTIRVTVNSSESTLSGGQVSVPSVVTVFDLPVTVVAVADAPTLSTTAAVGNEDSPIPFGTSISYGVVDSDGSEVVSSIAISGVPAGATLTYVVATGASIGIAGGIWTITGDEAAIRATLDSFAVQAGADKDNNFGLTITVATTDTGGVTATTTLTQPITVNAVADAPTGSGTAIGTEDNVPVSITLANTDTDDSQSITAVQLVTSVAGLVLNWTNALGATVTVRTGGIYDITGSETAIRAVLATLIATPPANTSGAFSIDVTVTSSETNPSETGEIAVASASTTFTIPVVANAEADAPTLATLPATGSEDTAIIFGTGITYGLVDTDGSEVVSAVALSGVPTDAVVTYTIAPGAFVSVVSGVWTITGDQTAIRTTLDSFAVLPGFNTDANFAIAVAVTTTDSGVSTATTLGGIDIVVRAVADAPTASGSASGDEDSDIPLSITMANTDTDSTQSITAVTLVVPTGSGTLSWTNQPGATVIKTGDSYEVTGTESAIRAVLGTMTVRPAANSDTAFDIAVTVVSSETNPTTTGEVATLNASTTFNLPVIITAVADAPSVPATSTTGNEDVAISFGENITYGLTDTDGSETVTSVTLTGFPVGSTVANAGGVGITFAAGVYTITGTPSEIRTRLDSFTVTAPNNSDGNLSITVGVTTTDTGGVTATTSGTHSVVVRAVADAPTTSGSASGNEDSDIPLSITMANADTDGTQSISSVTLVVPTGSGTLSWTNQPGATVIKTGDSYAVTGTESAIRAVLGTMTVRPAANSDTAFDIAVTVVSSETNPTTVGEVATLNASTTFNLPVTITAVADAPSLTATNYSGEEDTRIPLTGIAAAVSDTDGSETITAVRITDVPTGALFTNAAGVTRGTDNGDGTWSFTAAELTGLHFVPALHVHGVVNMVLEATATETANGDTETTTRAFSVTVDAQADAPTVSAGAITVDEDTLTTIGTGISYALVDQDGSERVSSVNITGFPTGATVSLVAVGTATVTAITGGYSVSGTSAADIRATLDALAIRAEGNNDVDIALTVAVTTTDADSSSSTASNTLTLNLSAIADKPTVSGGVTGNEDAVIAVPVTVLLTDTDGSETLKSVVVSQVPVDAVLGWNTSLPGTVTANADGTFSFTGSTTHIQALLASLTITPPLHSDTDFSLRVTATSTESNPTGGQVTTLDAVEVFDVPVIITAVADAPSVPATSATGNEDAVISFGENITYALTDTDGSETVTSVTLTGFPVGSTVANAGGPGITFAAGVYTITGTPSEIRTRLDSFTVTAPGNSDGNLSITVGVTTTDTGGVTATTSGTHTVVVRAVADAPTASGSASGNEDNDIPLVITMNNTDTDGSQSITAVTLVVPTGSGTLSWTNQPGATVIKTGDSYAVTGTESAIRAVLGTMTVRPAANSDTAFDIAVTVVSSETNPTTTGEVATLNASTTFNLPVTIIALADPATVPNTSTTGTEDTAISFGGNVTYWATEQDGSETATTVVVSGVPTGWMLTGTNTNGGSFTSSGGIYTITGTPAGIRDTLNTFSLTPPLDDDADVVLTVAITTTDTGNISTNTTATHTVVVVADADTPALTVGAASFSGNEEDPIALTGFSAALTDTDGTAGRPISEVFDVVRITGVPVGSKFQVAGADVGSITAGVWTGTAAQLAGLTFVPTPELSGVFTLNLQAITRETVGGDLSPTASLPFTITLLPIPDKPIVTVGTSTGAEDTTFNFGSAITYVKVDNDGSETITQVVISGIDLAWAVGFTATGGASVNTATAGTYIITGSETAIRSTLNSFTIRAPLDSDADTSVTVAVTSTDSGGGTATSTPAIHTIVVTADADVPTVNVGVGTFTTNEDFRISLAGFAVAISDTDAAAGRPVSETISLVRITGVQTGALFQNGAGATVGTITAGVWTGTAAQLADLYYLPAPETSGIKTMTLEATARETSNLDTEIFSRTFTVDVIGVPDQVTVVPAGYSINEDTLSSDMGNRFGVGLIDNDGSQTLNITLTGLPTGTGAIVTTNTDPGVTKTYDSATGTMTLAGASNLVLAILNSLDIRAPANSDVDLAIGISVTTTENSVTLAPVLGTLNVIVKAIADPVTITGSVSALEDIAKVVPITVALQDTDGTETYNYVDIRLSTGTLPAPAGTTLSVVASGSATVVYDLPTKTFRVTGTTADIQATLLGGVTVISALHNGNNFNIEVSAQTQESAVGASQVTTATTTTAFTAILVTVTDQADPPDVTVPSSVTIEEDTALILTGLGITKVDTDGSETFTLTLAGVPDGSSFGVGVGTPGANVGGVRTWVFTEAQVSGLTFTPPLNLHGSWVITASTTSRETENSNTATSGTKTFTITVDADADKPTISATNSIGNEDAAINFGATLATPATGIALYDMDGSERITSVTLSGFPAGITPTYSAAGGSVDTVTTPGSYIITAASEAAIRAILATFTLTQATNSDDNITINVTANTIDPTSTTGLLTNSQTATHTIVVRGIADQPGLTTAAASGTEDTAILLPITADRTDIDGSEVLSVRITLPAGVTTGTITGNTSGGGAVTNQGGGVFLITAPTEAQLDAILATVRFTPPTNWSGTTNLGVESISTETGPEIFTATSTRSSTLAVTVGAIVDAPQLRIISSTGGASGYEDQPVRLSITVTLVDGDGSESYVVRLSNQPVGAVYTNAGGVPIGVEVSPGVWEFTSAQLAILHIIPPLNSSNDFILNVSTIVTDTGPTGTSTTTLNGTLPVNVIGVADAPTVITPLVINSIEDQPIALGLNATAALVDTDGSETLYFVIAGLPAGVVPSRGTYIGGEWQISASDMPFVTINPPANLSGSYLPGLVIRAITQESDGDQAVSNIAVNINLTPVVDGFAWSPGVAVNEESAIPLSAARFTGALIDNDGSEVIRSYTLDLNGVVAAANISGVVGSTANFIANYIAGPFTNNGDGTITVLAANMASVSFLNTAFLNSNVDFSIPIYARVEEPDGAFVNVSSNFAITLLGVADVPTVFAGSVSGTSGSLIALNPTGAEFGGLSTDTDVALGRPLSERFYYIVSGLQSTPGIDLAFTNAAGTIVGLDNGDGTWLLEPADLVGLSVLTRAGGNGTVTMSLTTIAVENDTGSRSQSTTNATFSVTVVPGSGGTGPAPFAPVVTINTSTGNEDGSITLNVNAVAAPGDPTTPTITVLFSGVPAGFTLVGATLNTSTGRWIATAADVNAGIVRLVPPANWSGSLTGVNTLQVEAIATNAFLNRTSTGLSPAPINITPVADGPSITAAPPPGVEDQPIALNLSVVPLDGEASSPEVLTGPIVVTVPAGTILSAGTNIGGNVWNLTAAQLAGLTLTPPSNYNGPLTVTVQATTQDMNGATQSGSSTINLTVAARADLPTATASNVSGNEDAPIALTGLSAALTDNDGSEVLSVKISGVPEGTLFNAGGNNGDGTWTIPVSALATLSLLPPPQYSGVMSLTLNAYSLELSNGLTNVNSVPFTVTIAPVADSVSLDPTALTIAEDTPTVLPLHVLLEDRRGTAPGETPAETVRIDFTGLPTGSVLASAGATLVDLGSGAWRFTGTQVQANAIMITTPTNYAGVTTIGMSAVTIDGGMTLAIPVTDSFVLTVTPVADAPVLQANPITGLVSTPLAVNVFAFPNDTDGSETVSVTFSNVPAGSTFNAGTDLGGGTWRFTEAQLVGLTMTLPVGATSRTITVVATATETANGSTATTPGTIVLTVGSGAMSLLGTPLADLLTGGAGADTLNSGAGNDTLNGGLGNDSMVGGLGDDVYFVDSATDTFVELAGGGTDEVRTTLLTQSIAGAVNIENLTYIGTGNFTGTGNTGANVLTGGIGNDTLNGGTGADTLVGGTGNDTYFVENIGDVVTEAASSGTDTISTTLTSQSLAGLSNVENLIYTGALAFTGTGNTGANSITGGSGADTLNGGDGNDTLDGGSGNDSMVGGIGDDVYLVNSATDVVTEAASAGNDTIRTTLTAQTIATLVNVENLTFIGAGNFTGTGNTGANSITGGTGNDTLNGGDGADTLDGGLGNDSMIGGIGDDVYLVNSATDVVTEAAGAGTDTIRTTLNTQTIAALANVENLTFIGTGNFTGTGNTGANSITGGTGNDTLDGGVGNDILIGGTGNDSILGGNNNDTITGGQGADTLVGGTGADTFLYNAGDAAGGVDTITGFTSGAGGDVLNIDALIPGYTGGPTLSSFVNLFESAGNTSVQIDPTGTSSFSTTILTLTGVTGLTLATMQTNGNLIA